METYVEIYLRVDGKSNLHSRVIIDKALAEVLEELRGNRFDILLVCNRCVVGTGSYDYADGHRATQHEDGACKGFLDRYFQV